MKKAPFLAWLAGLIFLNIIDAIWHTVVFVDIYAQGLANIATIHNGAPEANFAYITLVEAVFVAGLVYFVINRLPQENRVANAIGQGALFGLVTYGLHTFLNLSIVTNYDGTVAILDLVRSLLMGALISLIALKVYDALNNKKA